MSKTALFKAARSWDAKAVAALVDASPDLVWARDARGRTALHLCAGRPLRSAESAAASIATAKALLRAGAGINAVHEIPDDDEIFPATALWYAVGRGANRELAKFLLSAGANPDYCLWTVVWSKDLETARLLLKAGARTELRFDSETPLLYAARLGREALILELVAWKVKIGVKDSKGMTPLDYALKRRLNDRVIAALGGANVAQRRSSKRRRVS